MGVFKWRGMKRNDPWSLVNCSEPPGMATDFFGFKSRLYLKDFSALAVARGGSMRSLALVTMSC